MNHAENEEISGQMQFLSGLHDLFKWPLFETFGRQAGFVLLIFLAWLIILK